ncbi:hypothetical protein BJ742DRAFT_267566 [Cladochytrium replicatum]|nr:hypothetical protein BJ742DRAFT_267566 [Cladochytrium replicatum]
MFSQNIASRCFSTTIRSSNWQGSSIYESPNGQYSTFAANTRRAKTAYSPNYVRSTCSYAPSYESFERWYSNRPQTSATWNRDQHVYHDPYPAQPVHDRWPLHSNPSVAAYEAGIPGHPGFHQSSFSANDVVVSSAIASAVGAANSTVIAVSNDFATSASSSSATATSAKSLNSESSRLNESTVESRPRSYHPATTRILDTESSSHGGALPMDDEEDGGRLISDEHGPGKTSLTVNTRIPENSKLDERNDMSTTESSTVLNVEAIEQVMDYCDIIRNLAKIVQNSGNGEDAANNEEDFEQIVADLVAKVGEFHQFIQDCQFTFSMEAQNEESEFDKTKHPTSPPRPKYQKRNRSMPRPGRCHSCNISETPEWRRGPDGARTLCNACGLHFAKLMRKRQRLRADLSDNGSGGDSTGGFGGRSSGSPAVLVGAGDAADEQVLHRLQSFAKRREDENAHRTQRRHNLAPLSIPRHASPQNQKRTRRPFDNPPEDAMTTSNDSSTMLDNRGRKEDGLDDRPVQVHDSTSGAGTDVAQEDMGTGSGRKKLRTA